MILFSFDAFNFQKKEKSLGLNYSIIIGSFKNNQVICVLFSPCVPIFFFLGDKTKAKVIEKRVLNNGLSNFEK